MCNGDWYSTLTGQWRQGDFKKPAKYVAKKTLQKESTEYDQI